MFENINFEKYLGKSYEEFYNDLFILKEMGKTNSSHFSLSVSTSHCNYAVERDYEIAICNVVGNVMDGKDCKTEIKELLEELFLYWMHEVKYVHWMQDVCNKNIKQLVETYCCANPLSLGNRNLILLFLL